MRCAICGREISGATPDTVTIGDYDSPYEYKVCLNCSAKLIKRLIKERERYKGTSNNSKIAIAFAIASAIAIIITRLINRI